MDVTLLPTLPADMERLIFETAAVLWPRLIPTFMLVAWRVKIWVEPILYRTLIVVTSLWDLDRRIYEETHPFIIESSVLLSLIHTKSPPFFRDSDAAIILSTCSNVQNLWLQPWSEVVVPQRNLPLKRLHSWLSALFPSGHPDFTHPMFASITHLEIFDTAAYIDEQVLSALTLLRSLTHLAVKNDNEYLPMRFGLLRPSTSLRVVALLLDRADWDVDVPSFRDVPELALDARFVIIHCPRHLDAWILEARNGQDSWSRAEDFIAKRTSREVDDKVAIIHRFTLLMTLAGR
ncbi:hypothetical protein DFH06DRAFT_1293966 [Mycena polygramma]|nr:hypothetical protein DFH06DRAFT_1293966 [Mycena polygramma]